MKTKIGFKNRRFGHFNRLPSAKKLLLPRVKTALWLMAASSVLVLFHAGGQSTNHTPGSVMSWGAQVMPYVAPGTSFTMISLGDVHSLAVKKDGTVFACGDNSWGQCNVPAGLNGVKYIAAIGSRPGSGGLCRCRETINS